MPKVYAAGATRRGRPYFVMEWIDGVPIHQWCAEQKRSLPDRLQLVRDLCAAVQHAHHNGIIHRDLKPSNILVCADADCPRGAIKVIDFGIAKATRETGEDMSLLTRVNQVVGTPAYMSPEQISGADALVDTRSDVYAIGVVLYELLTGGPPFGTERENASSLEGLQQMICEERPTLPSRRIKEGRAGLETGSSSKDLRHELDWITLTALAKDPAHRYQSPSELAADLERYLKGDPVHAVPPSRLYLGKKFVRRYRTFLLSLGLIFLTLAAGLVASLHQTRKATHAERKATAATHAANDAKNKALDSERDALRNMSALFAIQGNRESADEKPLKAAVWFAQAARSAEMARGPTDPEGPHLRANQLRATTVTETTERVVRAFNPGIPAPTDLHWHPSSRALYVGNGSGGQVWNIETETPWEKAPVSSLWRACWHPDGHQLAAFDKQQLLLIAYPSGEILRELPRVTDFAWSPDGNWLALGTNPLTLWNCRTDETKIASPELVAPTTIKWNSQSSLLLKYPEGVSMTDVPALEQLRFAPLPYRRELDAAADFINRDGDQFYINGPKSLRICNSLNGETISSNNYSSTELRPQSNARTSLRLERRGHLVRPSQLPLHVVSNVFTITWQSAVWMGEAFAFESLVEYASYPVSGLSDDSRLVEWTRFGESSLSPRTRDQTKRTAQCSE